MLSVSGPDWPGILAELARALDAADLDLVDLTIEVAEGIAHLSVTLDLHGDEESVRRLREEVVPAVEARGLGTRLHELLPEAAAAPRGRGTDHLVLTLVSGGFSTKALAGMAACAAGHRAGLVSVRRLSDEDLRAAEYLLDVSAVEDVTRLRRDLLLAAEEWGVDAGLAWDDAYRGNPQLVIFDMDSTLVQEEIIDMLAAAHGVGAQVAEVTRAAMEGHVDFATALRQRVKLLAGFPEDRLATVAARIHPTPGVESALATLRSLGVRLGVLSGGFTFFVERFRERLGLDHAFANTLEVRDGALTGELVGEIVDAGAKARLLLEIASREGVSPAAVVAIGDGANDIPMLQAAGLGIAFHAKEAARRAADACILGNDFSTLLYLLGISDRDRNRFEER